MSFQKKQLNSPLTKPITSEMFEIDLYWKRTLYMWGITAALLAVFALVLSQSPTILISSGENWEAAPTIHWPQPSATIHGAILKNPTVSPAIKALYIQGVNNLVPLSVKQSLAIFLGPVPLIHIIAVAMRPTNRQNRVDPRQIIRPEIKINPLHQFRKMHR